MNKLEKVALRSAKRTGRPLVLVINNVHYFKNDDGGQNMLMQLQQRAEAWAASGSHNFSSSALGHSPTYLFHRHHDPRFQLVSPGSYCGRLIY